MDDDGRRELGDAQRAHWQETYTAHPGMYGEQPSAPARHATEVFRAAGARDVLELGAGQGRDTLALAHEGFTVRATDFSAAALEQLRAAARAQGVEDRVTCVVHDVRPPLPLPDDSVDAVFAHMLLCMALSTPEIHAVAAEVRRVLRPGGVFVHTVRHTGDAHCGTGTAHGDETSTNTAASPFTPSLAPWSTPSPTAGSWRRSTPSRRATSPAACGA
ncbi:class I SAM-dependent methyltransferase [Streptomyces litchfieldiae]|uniref:Class I SAM-dependent methyltransferase n=1 Tax=Streptomyces litchfieldiae TaxID=3075543 RepID=A0ABU2MSC3_9ACTN|nr:class I SAM-dependent methyltransferase [Streptomyces sp. DSM 44938]MDT0343994.1 class I SAM-dependent methyltransferase [Streptomyces sp. DSM 44938]